MIVISRCCLFIFALSWVGCVPDDRDDRPSEREANYRKMSCFLGDYHASKGRYPTSLVQLEHYFLAKQNQSDSKISHDPQNILGITNPYHREMVGYGKAYANVWDFEMVIDKHKRVYIVNCEERQMLYHPTNHGQGFILFDCREQLGNKNPFDYANRLCFHDQCLNGKYFEYKFETKSIQLNKDNFSKNYGKICG